MAILQGEPEAAQCRAVIAEQDEIFIAAPTLTEALIVAAGRELHGEMANLISNLELTVLPFTEGLAYAAVRQYVSWGKGFHPAKLNYGDCFSYATALEQDCPLLFVGDDFAKTDVRSAIA